MTDFIRRVKPRPGARVDWGNPINRDLVGWWIFNEGAGNLVQDIAKGHDGATVNMSPADWVGSPHGGTIHFDGTDDYISIGDLLELDGANGLTVSTWLNPDVINFSGQRGVFARGNSGERTPWVWGPSGTAHIRIQIETPSGPGDINLISADLTAGVWFHVVFAWDGVTCTAYTDGIPGNTDTSTSNVISDQVLEARIGLIDSFAEWDGLIENVSVWTRGLVALEVQELFHNPYGGVVQRGAREYFVPTGVVATAVQDVIMGGGIIPFAR